MTRSKNILIAEDEEHTSATLFIILKKAGFKVVTVTNGLEAVNFIVSRKNTVNAFDLLITDIQMPGLTGTELVSELRKINSSLPVLVITGYNDNETQKEILDQLKVEFIQKPFDPDEILLKIYSIINRN